MDRRGGFSGTIGKGTQVTMSWEVADLQGGANDPKWRHDADIEQATVADFETGTDSEMR